MTFWILACLALYLVNIYIPTVLYLPAEGMARHLGPRDDLPPASAMVGRARRSLANFQENLPIFLGLALLSMIVEGADSGRALLGAQIFVISRVAYIPLYLAGVPLLRSLAYTVGLFGCLLMAIALV